MTSSQIDFLRPTQLNSSAISSWFTLKNPHFHTFKQKIPGLNIGLNSKEDENIVLHNISILSTSINTNTKDLAIAKQVHKTHIEIIKEGGFYNNTDAFVTNTQGVALCIQVADCGAVLLGDKKNMVIGAAHAGWRGAVAGIVPKTVNAMISLGADIEYINAYLSPCLSLHNFEVGEEVAEQFSNELVDRTSYLKPHVDLKGLIKSQLLDVGILVEHIEIDEKCTVSEKDLFYSYRREKEKSGRMVGIIKLNTKE